MCEFDDILGEINLITKSLEWQRKEFVRILQINAHNDKKTLSLCHVAAYINSYVTDILNNHGLFMKDNKFSDDKVVKYTLPSFFPITVKPSIEVKKFLVYLFSSNLVWQSTALFCDVLEELCYNIDNQEADTNQLSSLLYWQAALAAIIAKKNDQSSKLQDLIDPGIDGAKKKLDI